MSEIVSGGVTSGSTTSVTSIGSGQADSSVTVLSGGTLLNTDLVSGGTGTFDTGATISGLVISDDASASLAGFASGVTVTATTDTTNGQLIIISGGVLSNAAIDDASGYSSGDTLLVISNGGSANDVTMSYSGDFQAIVVSSGGSATNFTLQGGNMVVSAGGTVDTVTANTAGLEVESGGVASGVTLTNRGFETVVSGGTTSDVVVSSGGSEILSGGVASGTVVNSGGYEYVGVGGTELDAFISSGGTISVAQGGQATIATGSGGVIDDFGALALTGAVTGTTVDMEGTIGSTLTDTGSLSGGTFTATALASNFAASDSIVIAGSDISGGLNGSFANESYDNLTGILSFTDSGNGETFAVAISPATAGTYSASDFTLSAGGGDILITTDIPCFCAGTSLLTMQGETRAEDIQIGDELVTVREGGPASRKVVWTGKRAIDISRHPRPELVRPVRIIAGAFGDNVPQRDLRLSPLHAVYVNGCLFEAISLVNGSTIYQEQNTRHVTYHHIELDAHDIILAEGLGTETFLDTGDRSMFENVSGVTVLHPGFAAPADAKFCAPMVREGEQLDQLRAELNERAALRKTA